MWRTNFGTTMGLGGLQGFVVPEPSASLLASMTVALWLCSDRGLRLRLARTSCILPS